MTKSFRKPAQTYHRYGAPVKIPLHQSLPPCFPGLAPAGIFAYPVAHMVRFSIFGIPVEVQPFFWITLVILGGALDANSASAVFEIVLFVLAGFISVLVHELGHALTARHFGAQTHIVLQAFGGYAAYTGARMTRTRSFLITAAGPAIQILLGVAVFALLIYLPPMNYAGRSFLRDLVWISVFWAVINLLPVVPLDGGQMLNAVLGPQRIHITLWTSIIVAMIAAVGMFMWTHSIIFPLFLAMFGWQAWQELQQQRPR